MKLIGYLRAFVTLVLVVCALGAVAATFLGRIEAESGVSVAVLFALAAVLSQVERFMGAAQASLARMDARDVRRRRQLADLLATEGVPPIRDVDPYALGVRRSQRAEVATIDQGSFHAAYVRREIDERLRLHLRERRAFVLLVGESRAGKSRTAYEAISSSESGLSGHKIIVPRRFGIGPDTLRRLFSLIDSANLGARPAVLWLDDLQRYLDAAALTPDLLSRQRSKRDVVVVATIRSEEYQRLRFSGSSDVREAPVDLAQAREVLSHATVEILDGALRARELSEAHRIYPGTDWERTRLGEALVLAPELIEKLATATAIQRAVVFAAVDWDRAGVPRPISKAELASLTAFYEPEVGVEQSLQDALTWAMAPLADSSSALLDQVEGGYKADDFIVAFRGTREEVTSAKLQRVLELVQGREAFAVGSAAYTRGLVAFAVAAWRKASAAADAPTAARALINTGIGLDQLGRSLEAVEAYDEAVQRFSDSSAPLLREQVAVALVGKGKALEGMGRLAEAAGAYDEVVLRFADAAEPQVRAQVARALFSKAFASSRDATGAVAAYDELVTRFADADEPAMREQVATALLNKGVTLEKLKGPAEALATYDELLRRFSEVNEAEVRDVVAAALVSRGHALRQLRRPVEAIAAYDEVARRFGDLDDIRLHRRVAVATISKGDALRDLGRDSDAAATYRSVVRRFGSAATPEIREQVARALVHLAQTLEVPYMVREIADEVVRRFGDASESAMRHQVARALMRKAQTMLDPENRVRFYDDAVRLLRQDNEPLLTAVLAEALVAKGRALARLSKTSDAVAVYDEVIRQFGSATAAPVSEYVESALLARAILLGTLRGAVDAIHDYDEYLRRMNSQIGRTRDVAKAMLFKALALEALNRRNDAADTYSAILDRFRDPADHAHDVAEVARILRASTVRWPLAAIPAWDYALGFRFDDAGTLRQRAASHLYQQGSDMAWTHNGVHAQELYMDALTLLGGEPSPVQTLISSVVRVKGSKLSSPTPR